MKKKKPNFKESPPEVLDLNEAKALIDELWEQLRHYEDKLATNAPTEEIIEILVAQGYRCIS